MNFQTRLLVQRLFILFLLSGFFLSAVVVQAAPEKADEIQAEQKHVLILMPGSYGVPWYENVTDAVYSYFNEAVEANEVKLHLEYTGIDSDFNQEYMLLLRDFYANKFGKQTFDLIISESGTTTEFLLQFGDELFPGTPIVFVARQDILEKIKPNMTGIFDIAAFQDNLVIALELHPATRYVAVVSGAGEYEKAYEKAARHVFQPYENDLEFIYLSGLPLDELYSNLQELPENTIVFFLMFFVDGDGAKIREPREVVSQVAEYSNKPVYGLWDTFLGYGIVGGHLSSAEATGTNVAELGTRILQGENPADIPIMQGSFSNMFDNRQLLKWGISENYLPPGSELFFVEETFWERNKLSILLSALGLLTSGILVLFYRTKRIERDLHKQEQAKRTLEDKVAERTAELEKVNLELKRLSQLDGLTGIHNRRYFDSELAKEWKRHNRAGLPLSLIMCDIDYFKDFNDTYGHLAGDECLKMVANAILEDTKRSDDIATRYGGEEFAIILPNTDLDGATKVAEAIRNSIGMLEIPHATSEVKPIVSLSCGVATIIPMQCKDPEIIIMLADKALYLSKKNGRDQVQVVTE